MSSLLDQATSSRTAQLVATAVVSGAVVASVLLGYQRHEHAQRLRELKEQGLEAVDRHHEGHLHHHHGIEDESHLDAEERRALALARRAQKGDYAEDVILEQLTRNRAFLTDEGLAKVREAVVVIVGCGGVGSHCAAALARSGVRRIRLVDFDQVSLSSLNRHAVATLADVGRPKVQVLARRLLAVAPWVQFDARQEKYDEEAAGRLLGAWDASRVLGSERNEGKDEKKDNPTFIIDCIDNIDTKVSLLAYCHSHGLPVIASMGAATKSDPTKVTIGDLAASAEDGLSRATRRRLKLRGITKGIPAVYSTEVPGGDGKATLLPLDDAHYALGKDAVRELGALPSFRVRILPVLGTMPAVFGYTLANHVLLQVSGYPHDDYAVVKGRDKLYDQVLAAVHGAEEKLVRRREAAAGVVPQNKDLSQAKGLRLPMTPGDVAFLLEEVYHGRSVVSGLPTRLTLVRWSLPDQDDGSVTGTMDVLQVDPTTGLLSPDSVQPLQRRARLRLADLVCMTREEATRHQDAVLLRGESASTLYDEATLARIEERRREASTYEKWRC